MLLCILGILVMLISEYWYNYVYIKNNVIFCLRNLESVFLEKFFIVDMILVVKKR